MKKQHKTYFLLLAVLVIWSLIGYQIYIRLNPPTPKLEALKIKTGFVRKKNVPHSSYEVQANYRDPFLGKFPKKKVVKKRVSKPKVTLVFPNVVYNGIVEGGSSKSYILTVNNHQEILKLGEFIQKVKLIRANSKEALVSFEGIKKTIPLQ